MTTEERTVSDELHAAAIRDATETLNGALAKAWMAGLAVSVDVREHGEISRRDRMPRIDVTVARPL